MKRTFLLLTALIFIISCNREDPSSGSNESGVALTWSFQENDPEGHYYSAEFVLKNLKDEALTDQGWTLYFNQQGLGVLNETVTGNVDIKHINGDLLSITPQEGFLLEPGASVVIAYRKPGSFLLESEAPLHPYMVYEGTEEESQTAVSIDDYTLLPFPSLDRFYPPGMGIVLPDASWVYAKNSGTLLLEPGETGKVIPTPVKENYTGSNMALYDDLAIAYEIGMENEASYLSEMLKNVRGSAPNVVEGTDGIPGTITLRIDPRMLSRIKRLARSRFLNYQSMIKQWLSERLEQEPSAEARKQQIPLLPEKE